MLVDDLDGRPARRRRAPASATPAGRPTAARPTATRTRTSATTASSPSSTTASSRTSPSSRRSCSPTGATFTSETDTEVAATARRPRVPTRPGDLTEALRARRRPPATAPSPCSSCTQDQPGVVVGARRNSPLVIGLGDGENFLGSDVAAFVEYTRRAVAIGQDQIVTIRPDSVEVTDFDGNPVETEEFEIAWDASAAEKGGWSSFMAKEISEEPEAVAKTLLGRVARRRRARSPSSTRIGDEVLADIDRIVVIACGTAAYAGMLGKYAIEKWARIPVEVELSHEFRYRDPILDRAHPRRLDQPVRRDHGHAHGRASTPASPGAQALSICNTQGATIPRESRRRASTRTPAPRSPSHRPRRSSPRSPRSTCSACTSRACAARSTDDEIARTSPSCRRCPTKIAEVLAASQAAIGQLAHWMTDTQSVLFLGRHVGYPVALEGALKLKELAYIHAEGFAAGELKHGPIALIEPGQIVFVDRAEPARPARRCTRRSSRTSRRSAPAVPA